MGPLVGDLEHVLGWYSRDDREHVERHVRLCELLADALELAADERLDAGARFRSPRVRPHWLRLRPPGRARGARWDRKGCVDLLSRTELVRRGLVPDWPAPAQVVAAIERALGEELPQPQRRNLDTPLCARPADGRERAGTARRDPLRRRTTAVRASRLRCPPRAARSPRRRHRRPVRLALAGADQLDDHEQSPAVGAQPPPGPIVARDPPHRTRRLRGATQRCRRSICISSTSPPDARAATAGASIELLVGLLRDPPATLVTILGDARHAPVPAAEWAAVEEYPAVMMPALSGTHCDASS